MQRKGTAQAASARGKFQGYKREKPEIVRAAKVTDSDIRKMYKAWERFISTLEEGDLGDQKAVYEKALPVARSLEYSASDVEKFSIAFQEFSGVSPLSGGGAITEIGLFLSALINTGKEKSYRIVTHNLGRYRAGLGYRNEKELTIIGPNAGFLGYGMCDGSITVYGDADQPGVSMSGGKIRVEGNVIAAGNMMTGGIIEIFGNVVGSVGSGMRGGEIIIKGNLGALGERIRGGKIIVEGTVDFPSYEIKGGEIHLHGGIGSKIIGVKDAYEVMRGRVTHGKVFYKGRLIVDK